MQEVGSKHMVEHSNPGLALDIQGGLCAPCPITCRDSRSGKVGQAMILRASVCSTDNAAPVSSASGPEAPSPTTQSRWRPTGRAAMDIQTGHNVTRTMCKEACWRRGSGSCRPSLTISSGPAILAPQACSSTGLIGPEKKNSCRREGNTKVPAGTTCP
jgi:hypothetical protein